MKYILWIWIAATGDGRPSHWLADNFFHSREECVMASRTLYAPVISTCVPDDPPNDPPPPLVEQ
jgi:hypothetical protein